MTLPFLPFKEWEEPLLSYLSWSAFWWSCGKYWKFQGWILFHSCWLEGDVEPALGVEWGRQEDLRHSWGSQWFLGGTKGRGRDLRNKFFYAVSPKPKHTLLTSQKQSLCYLESCPLTTEWFWDKRALNTHPSPRQCGALLTFYLFGSLSAILLFATHCVLG